MDTTPNTEAIDKLFLELSQFTKASTAKELKLSRAVVAARALSFVLSRKLAKQVREDSPATAEAYAIASDLVTTLDDVILIARKAL